MLLDPLLLLMIVTLQLLKLSTFVVVEGANYDVVTLLGGDCCCGYDYD